VVVHACKAGIVTGSLIVGFRLFGKRELAQLNVYDLAMLFALGNAVQNAITGGRGNIAVGLATSSSIVLIAWALTRVLAVRPKLESRVLGSPVIVIRNGQVLKERLRRQRISRDELGAAVRAYGLESPKEVALGVLEVDGSISIIARAEGQASSESTAS
jgi:uncharacterized membrane protein YcaP (DUF421 family)